MHSILFQCLTEDQNIIQVKTKNLLKNSFNTSFMSRMNMFDALVNPRGMTNHSYKPSFIQKAIFHQSPSLIQIW